MKQLHAFPETTAKSKISMLGKEETIVLSSTLQNETPNRISKNVEAEIDRIIKNSTLGEENIILSQKKGLQKGKISRTNFTSKPKRRVNNLQKLNQTTENVTSLPSEEVYNSTTVKTDKVQ